MVDESVGEQVNNATNQIIGHMNNAIHGSNQQLFSQEVLLLKNIQQMRQQNYLEAVQGDTKSIFKTPYLKLTVYNIIVWTVGLMISIGTLMAVWLSYDKDPYIGAIGILMLSVVYGVTFVTILNNNIRKNFEMQVLKRWIFSLVVPDDEEEEGQVEQSPHVQ